MTRARKDAKARLTAQLPEVAQNIENDPLLDEAEKNALYDHIAGQPTHLELDSLIKIYCYDHKLKGPVVALENNEILGRVHSLDAMANLVSDELRITIEAALDLLNNMLCNNELASSMLEQLSELPLSRGILWSFLNGEATVNPFNGEDLETILCKLGIENTKARYIHFGHLLPEEITAHQPTVFDAGTDRNWRPGGRTEPLNECKNQHTEGHVEIVHTPNYFKNITTSIEEL